METEKSKVSTEAVIRAVVNYVRTLVNVDDIEALGAEIFGSSTDVRIGKLKEVVDYYNSGSEDGYKNLLTKRHIENRLCKKYVSLTPSHFIDTLIAFIDLKIWD